MNTITNKEIILKTLEHINDKGFVDVKPFWNGLSIPEDKQTSIKQMLSKNGLVRFGYGEPFQLEITDPKGVYVLNNPNKLKDNGELKLGISKKVELFTKKYWILVLIITYILGFVTHGLKELVSLEIQDYKKEQLQNKKNNLPTFPMILFNI